MGSTIQRATHPPPAFIEDMSIDHRSFDILVPQQFLDSANIVAILKQVRGKAMPKGVAAYSLLDTC
jgi:hypothetical protein